ncbi:hypothetical protein [Fimbriiglobus ruber]|uniref:hypothetical protein n=1 Tax=Fimbriiglobus ruber TaxID=1908690 RepID=UPI00117A5D84|nr:hypothetical protein [Fimbriiglobus ruber]
MNQDTSADEPFAHIWSAALYRRFCFSKNQSGGKAPHSKFGTVSLASPLILPDIIPHAGKPSP